MTTLQDTSQCHAPTDYMPESSPYDRMEPVELQEENALERVGSIPLVANTWDFVAAHYTSTKKTYPSVAAYLEFAEKITAGAANVALAATKPVVDKLGPTVNSYANRGLDKLEDALPQICDEPEEIYGSAKAAVALALNSRIDSALSVTERYVDYYLPAAEEIVQDEEDSGDEDDSDDDSDTSSMAENAAPATPKERLTVISHRVRQRAYHRAMDKVHRVQKRSSETLSKLKFTVDLIQYAKNNMETTCSSITSTAASANELVLSSMTATQQNVVNAWTEIKNRSSNAAAELHVLEAARDLTGRLQRSCGNLLTVVTKMPKFQYLAAKVAQAKESADALAQGLVGKSSFTDLSASLISTARSSLEHLQNLFDSLLNLVAEHAPAWLAPEFDSDPLEGLFMQDLEAELRMHDNNLPENFAHLASQSGNQDRLRRG